MNRHYHLILPPPLYYFEVLTLDYVIKHASSHNSAHTATEASVPGRLRLGGSLVWTTGKIWSVETEADRTRSQHGQHVRESHLTAHSQRTERITGSSSGSSKLSCSTLHVTLTPSARPTGTMEYRLMTVTVPACSPGS